MKPVAPAHKDVWLDKEHHKRVWIWQEQKKDNRPDIKDCARRLKQPWPNDNTVSGKFIVRW